MKDKKGGILVKIKKVLSLAVRIITAIIMVFAGIYPLSNGLALVNVLYLIFGLSGAGFILTIENPNADNSCEPCSEK